MPRPFRKIPRPPPSEVTVRHADHPERIEVFEQDEFVRRREEEAWRRTCERERNDPWDPHGYRLWSEQRRLALRSGDVITVPDDVLPDLRWFVRDVNGIERTLTACTEILGKPQERTFPFDAIEIVDFWDDEEGEHEAVAAYARLRARLGRTRNAA